MKFRLTNFFFSGRASRKNAERNRFELEQQNTFLLPNLALELIHLLPRNTDL